MFVTCMAPPFLVYVVVNGAHMLQIDDITCIDNKPQNHAHLVFIISIVLCIVLYVVLWMCTTMTGRNTRAEEEHAVGKIVAADLKQGDKGEVEWFDLNLLKDDVDLDVVGDEAKRFHFFDIDDGISNVSLETNSSDDDVQDGSRESVGRLGWCVLM